MTTTATGDNLSATKNWFGNTNGPSGKLKGGSGTAEGSGGMVSANVVHSSHWTCTDSTCGACVGPLAVYDAANTACVQTSANCGSKNADMFLRECSSSCTFASNTDSNRKLCR